MPQQMTAYSGSKLINAKPMNRLDYNDLRGWKLPADEDGTDEGYLVEYVDGGRANTAEFKGYISWSPKEVFEKAYRCSGEMTFGDAIYRLKAGFKMARKGWNGKGMFLYYVAANSYPVSGNPNSAVKGLFDNDMVPYGAYIAMKTADGTVIPWLASQSDMLASDWEEVK
jgi:hypothetical protein